jgi:hypothetical protein
VTRREPRRLPARIEGGWASRTSGNERVLTIRLVDPLNRATYAEVAIPDGLVLDLLSNRMPDLDAPTAEVTWYGIEHAGQEWQHVSFRVWLGTGSGRDTLAAEFTPHAARLAAEGWTWDPAELGDRFNFHRLAEGPDGTRVYRLQMGRYVEPGTPIPDWISEHNGALTVPPARPQRAPRRR